MVGVILGPRVCVGGRNRAEFSKIARKIARISTAKLQNFGAASAQETQDTRAESF